MKEVCPVSDHIRNPDADPMIQTDRNVRPPLMGMKPISRLTDEEWARAFVDCKIPNTGYRFGDTVAVLVKKLRQVREEEKKQHA